MVHNIFSCHLRVFIWRKHYLPLQLDPDTSTFICGTCSCCLERDFRWRGGGGGGGGSRQDMVGKAAGGVEDHTLEGGELCRHFAGREGRRVAGAETRNTESGLQHREWAEIILVGEGNSIVLSLQRQLRKFIKMMNSRALVSTGGREKSEEC